jgi:predicted O-methyltransferase YrrM
MIKNKSVSITLFMAAVYLTFVKDANCVSLLPDVDYSSAGMAQYMPEAQRTAENIALADEILARKYETERSSVSGEYGFSFCLEPEIFDYMQRNSNNKTILELGAAEGDVSILLAFGNANRVYVNDILPDEIAKFEATKTRLPAYVQEKLTSICCDYMEIPDRQPELLGSCDFVLFRNGFHFLRDADYPKFFGLLKSVLKPGGQIVVNAMALQPYIFQQLYPAFVGKPVNEHPT